MTEEISDFQRGVEAGILEFRQYLVDENDVAIYFGLPNDTLDDIANNARSTALADENGRIKENPEKEDANAESSEEDNWDEAYRRSESLRYALSLPRSEQEDATFLIEDAKRVYSYLWPEAASSEPEPEKKPHSSVYNSYVVSDLSEEKAAELVQKVLQHFGVTSTTPDYKLFKDDAEREKAESWKKEQEGLPDKDHDIMSGLKSSLDAINNVSEAVKRMTKSDRNI